MVPLIPALDPRDCAVLVLAKAPVPGLAKTRLIPALGAEGAAALAARMLRHTLDQAVAATLGPVTLCAAPSAAHAAFAELSHEAHLGIVDQGDGDLGARMQRAFERALSTHAGALLIGTDAPALDAATLRAAHAQLQDHDAVLGPAHDGGYVLIGLRRPEPRLFTEMPWSTPQVLSITRERLRAAGLRWAELSPLHDIDEPADLAQLAGRGWL